MFIGAGDSFHSFINLVHCPNALIRRNELSSLTGKAWVIKKMMRSGIPNHHRRDVVDFSFTRVIACRVGASVSQVARTGDFSRARRDRPPHHGVRSSDDESFMHRFPRGSLMEFTLEELRLATDDFNPERVIGRGGFGEVFRGTLANGTSVAIKVRSESSSQGREIFENELRVGSAISADSHPWLIPVIGYHFSWRRQSTTAMIVYAFMANGDAGCYTDDRQLERTPLDWPTRKRIALGAARGICSLHELRIVHRDVKPSNILLDEEFEARFGDFGIAKSMSLSQQSSDVTVFPYDEDSEHCDTTMVSGTPGYIAPEVFADDFHYSRKSDVFGFGVTLVQLVMGKPVIDRCEEGVHLLYRAERLFRDGEDLMTYMHPGMQGSYDEDEAIKLIQLGLICTENDPKKRPLMPEVIAIMEGSVNTLNQRWDSYNYYWINRLSSTANNQITGNQDLDEVPNDSVSETYEEELEENNINTIHSRGIRHWRQAAEVETELRELRDRMLAKELNHQAEMDEMRQKQIELMQSMAAMQELHTRQVNEMQAEIDRLRGFPEL
ncbi:hypothetical protein MLD38_030997 [Melastoma candidum]|uniref:Uncharacterized protein n=1 Tax=Melastoma candidum TaxID=119954 RepID=A0ACB9MMZ8_9MYRT|nr:hypothetical protein MLD38_030997 [Melastoma candidum]